MVTGTASTVATLKLKLGSMHGKKPHTRFLALAPALAAVAMAFGDDSYSSNDGKAGIGRIHAHDLAGICQVCDRHEQKHHNCCKPRA